jgi:hypothetical protein
MAVVANPSWDGVRTGQTRLPKTAIRRCASATRRMWTLRENADVGALQRTVVSNSRRKRILRVASNVTVFIR